MRHAKLGRKLGRKTANRKALMMNLASSLIEHKKLKISKFGTFILKKKKSRVGINFKTKEKKIISERNVVLFKPSKEFKEFVNSSDE